MPRFYLGINCGFAVNRYPEPDVWTDIVGRRLGLRRVQFVADLLNPFLPDEIIRDEVQAIRSACQIHDITIQSTFTSASTRVNHLLHPGAKIREVWLNWFKRFFRVSRDLGAEASGSHFGIMSMRDFQDSSRRREILGEGIRNWNVLSRYAKDLGLKYLLFEPMSVPREMAATIPETHSLLEAVNEKSAIPILLNLDVDHGDLASRDARDLDPYAWLGEFAKVSPVVHIKQSLADKSGHWPFTKAYNRLGIIQAPRVLEALEHGGAKEVTLLLEISHRERYPSEYRVVDDLEESVSYWREYVKE